MGRLNVCRLLNHLPINVGLEQKIRFIQIKKFIRVKSILLFGNLLPTRHKPKLPLKTVLGRKRTNRNSFECDSNDVDSFQQLYDLSKPLQEDEKNRRKDIEEASAKRNEVWVPPSEKVSIANSTRLYSKGMRQIVALERRRIKASEPGEYLSRLVPVLRSH